VRDIDNIVYVQIFSTFPLHLILARTNTHTYAYISTQSSRMPFVCVRELSQHSF